MKIAEEFVLLLDYGVNKRVIKHFYIGCKFQNSTSCPNDIIHISMQNIFYVKNR